MLYTVTETCTATATTKTRTYRAPSADMALALHCDSATYRSAEQRAADIAEYLDEEDCTVAAELCADAGWINDHQPLQRSAIRGSGEAITFTRDGRPADANGADPLLVVTDVTLIHGQIAGEPIVTDMNAQPVNGGELLIYRATRALIEGAVPKTAAA